MPPEPKKPIEELLEASAKARRAEFGPDPSMPNPMRVRLHQEIARRSEQPARGRDRSWFGLWWPRLSIAAAAAVVLVTASFIWSWHEPPPMGASHSFALSKSAAAPTLEMRQYEPAARAPVILESSPMPGALAAAGAQPPPETAKSESSEAAAATEKLAEGKMASDSRETDKLALAGSAQDAAQVPMAPPPARPALSANIAGNQAQSFANAPASAALARNQMNFRQQVAQGLTDQQLQTRTKLKQISQILNTFQIEQNGNEIRVVDADGSTYVGNIESRGRKEAPAKKAQAYSAPAPQERAKTAAKDESLNDEFYFRASGYNASLQKPVVFEGNYTVDRTAQRSADQMKSNRNEQTQARIVGTANIQGEAPVRVDATSTP